jgi:hypothetical protein
MTPVTRAIVIGGCVLVVLIVAMAVTTSWWNRHAPALVEAGQRALAEGRRYGQTASGAQCVDEVLRRRAATSRSAAATMTQRYFLQGCLVSSPAATMLCPRANIDSAPGGAAWLIGICAAHHGDRSCPALLQPLATYCAGRSPP